MPKFIIKNPKVKEELEYSIAKAKIVFGRTNTCDIEIPQKSVSRQHAQINLEGQDYFLIDLKSGNGTFLNGKKIRPQEKNLLRSGDVIQIEDYEIHFFVTDINAESFPEEDTNSDILEIKLIKKMLNALDTETIPSLEILTGVASGKKILLSDKKDPFVIGREEDSDFAIVENVISRHHVKLERKWGGIVITDLESKNGTFVNQERVKEKLLRDGDKVMLGTVKLLYRNSQDVNLDKISQEISKKKKEAALRESEILAEKQRKAERLQKEAEATEQAKKEAESQAVEQALPPPPPSHPAPPTVAVEIPFEGKPAYSPSEKAMIGFGILVGIIALVGLVLLLLK